MVTELPYIHRLKSVVLRQQRINLEQIGLLKRKISISETNYKNYNQALVEGAVSVLEIQTVKEKLIE